jgi:hypothetical protein
MACPYFMPTQRCEAELWPFRRRLPLGDGWLGYCAAPGYAGVQPSEEELKEGCNLGYALKCARLPQERVSDAVRFSVARDQDGKLQLCYVFELAHRPGQRGSLEYDCALGRWLSQHSEARVQHMAECFLGSYLSKRAAVQA